VSVLHTGPTDTIWENDPSGSPCTIFAIAMANIMIITAPDTSKIWERLLEDGLADLLESEDSEDSLELNIRFNHHGYLLIFKMSFESSIFRALQNL
jgi:hypothetical protein